MAFGLITKLVAPTLWGWLADHLGRRMVVVRLACLACALSFTGVFVVGGSYGGLALVVLGHTFFWHAALPQFEAVTFNHLGSRARLYSRVRMWGSVGFIVTALGMGWLLGWVGAGAVPVAMLGLFLAIVLLSFQVPEAPTGNQCHSGVSLVQVLARPGVPALLILCFFNQASHGSYYGFFSIYLEELGYSGEMIGALWVLGVVAEIALFMMAPRCLERFSPRRLLLAAMALTVLRWLLLGAWAANPPVLLLVQTLHAFSFGLYHAVAIHMIHRLFTGPHQGRGQALYSSLGFGAGGALGSLGAGYLWIGLGPAGTFYVAAGLAGLGLLVGWRGLRDD